MRPLLPLLLVLALGASAQDAPVPAADSAATAPDSVSAQALTSRLSTASGALGDYAEAYYQLDALNAGLDAPDEPANLQTPQAALEHFVRAGRAERFGEAAQALNLNLIPADEQAEAAPLLAEHLFYVLDTQLGFDWEGLPDRPDGASTESTGSNDALLGQPRRSLRLGTLDLDGRDVALRLQRVRAGGAAPVWVVSAQTVENVPALFRRYGPGPVDRAVPAWARTQVLGQTPLWAWLGLALGAMLVALLAWAVRRFVKRRLEGSDADWAREIAERVATPVAVFGGLLALYLLATAVLSLPAVVTTALLVAAVVAFVWLAMRAIGALSEYVAGRQGVDDISELSGDEKTDEQRWLTYLSVGRRVLLFVLVTFALGIVLSQFESLQALGFSLVASAGVATVVLGIAAQPVLGNIVASVQIALAKPVRIGDSVVYDGDWGYVEDVTYTYVLIQTWDQRRLVVPIRHLITHPFENWTIRNAHLVKPIYLYADYTIDVGRVRDKFDELLRASDDWDGENEPAVLVTGMTDETVEIRATCSAKDPSTAWDLHCALREELVAFLRDLDDGAYLPRQRVLTVGGDGARASVGAAVAGDGAG
ncbi:mechanosensitive ion channel family protein [Rubrivirga sp. S365]|uniref:Mechanosensitive ion channel family protein n=1 Tax=Rubrivirga litoralis TaxID=3075598 RepID=A0ABU3BQ21_9BACT|nr:MULTISPECIES: mechanosensitive ion channel family protein [unclassified Rubrivirga]MDT0631387.1 mechanosensitive ion channel family protein [Rubrivirga sp. F394]MDT7855978.1 mechanosensitive ion channel family protein [Rubrivirga sp. S365]